MDDAVALSQIAQLLAVPTRAAILLALADGRALPVSELAYRAGINTSTTSAHLARFVKAGLLRVEVCGRYRYYCLASPRVMEAAEDLFAVHGAPLLSRESRPDEAKVAPLRSARLCYDHLAGRLGVALSDRLQGLGLVRLVGRDYAVTEIGWDKFTALGLERSTLESARRHLARRCIDWSERRPHIGGAVGAALALYLEQQRWIRREGKTRCVHVTAQGGRGLWEAFGFHWRG